MKYATVASGIDAPAVAWNPMGWQQLWSSEIDKFPNAVLTHHYPDIPNLGDMNKIHEREEFKRPDLIMAGTPCQSFSIAGLREGLADPRGNLSLVFFSIIDQLQPKWVVWENVNDVRNANEGRDFATILGTLGQLGYGWAYRVLDARYFGVPQRRRRVFLIGHISDWRCAAAVLFERDSLSGNPSPSQSQRKEIAGTLGKSFGDRGYGIDGHGAYIPSGHGKYEIGDPTLRAKHGDAGGGSELLMINVRQDPILSDVAQPLDCLGNSQAVVSSLQSGSKEHGYSMTTDQAARSGHLIPYGGGSPESLKVAPALLSRSNRYDFDTDTFVAEFKRGQGAKARSDGYQLEESPTLTGADSGTQNPPGVQIDMKVRRLLPIECERLMGLPDNYTLIPYGPKGKPAKDSPRYRAIGNSIVRHVLEWLAVRIEAVEAILEKN